jgi:hypothetical protein
VFQRALDAFTLRTAIRHVERGAGLAHDALLLG